VLYDRAQIDVEAGAGGDGRVGFRREAHVPRGGPDGGDGGRGADVTLVCDAALRDLRALRRRRRYRAPDGGSGGTALRHGANGEELTIPVPPGTQVTGTGGDLEGQRWDLVRDAQRARVARGGAGGRGNKRFAGAARQTPRFAERGLPGERGTLELALKLLADVGLVGLPNAGKSSLLARLTRASPKVAPYPFTTLEPVLGVLERDERQLVLADIPGLIEGASGGAGLGDEFLAHVERTALLVHVVELAAGDDELTPALERYETVERELALYDPRLARLPRVLALSKADLVTDDRASQVAAELSRRARSEAPVIATSSATGAGLERLARELFAHTATPPHTGAVAREPARDGEIGAVAARGGEEMLAEHMVFRPGASAGFEVQRLRPGAFAVTGAAAETLVRRFDLDNPEAMAYVAARLRRLGVPGALRAEGFEPGDRLVIAGVPVDLGT
jgi:GTPase